ncbi:MAG: PAS domain S-box protein [Candidatus Obscuribacterales bacterium]|nr:PAS domain S-box protein [Candidatus Obscuribacterales bacterium]
MFVTAVVVGNLVLLLLALLLSASGVPAMAVIIGSLLISSALASGIWFYQMKKFNARLRQVHDNVVASRSGKALAEQMVEDDEIGRLDKSVYSLNTLIKDHRRSLESSDEKTRAIVRTVMIGIVVTDERGSILMVNPRTQEMLQRKAEDLVRKNVLEILQGIDIEAPFSIEKVRGKRLEASSQLNEKKVFLEISIDEFGKGSDNTWLMSLIDITERKELERLKQEFMQMITHDLRAPLTSILLYMEMLTTGRYGTLSEGGLERSKAVEISCQRLVDLVNNLLDVEKFSTGTIELDLDLSEVATIFERSVSALAGIIESKGLQVETVGADLELVCDEQRVTQVVVNLLSNAVKYSPNGGRIELLAVRTENGIGFAIGDHGPGIPDEFRDRVFDRFFQVPGKAKKGSSGLGLAICKEIIRAHHGEIGVDLNDGGGSRFWFLIPPLKAPASMSS